MCQLFSGRVKEMGVLIDKNDPADTALFDDAFKEVDYINQTSQRFELNSPKPAFTKSFDNKSSKDKTSSTNSSDNGYCIRTGAKIPFDVEKPLSYDAYKSWNKSGADPDHSEKFCHFSGEASNGETTVSKPILKKNWKKAKEIHGL